MNGNPRRPSRGVWLLIVGALAGLAVSILNYFSTSNGIHGTAGALLVVISTALMLLASVAIAPRGKKNRWWHGLLITLILLDIAGTAVAAYMLEAYWLDAAMAVALIGWIVHLATDPARRRPPVAAVTATGKSS